MRYSQKVQAPPSVPLGWLNCIRQDQSSTEEHSNPKQLRVCPRCACECEFVWYVRVRVRVRVCVCVRVLLTGPFPAGAAGGGANKAAGHGGGGRHVGGGGRHVEGGVPCQPLLPAAGRGRRRLRLEFRERNCSRRLQLFYREQENSHSRT